MALKILHTSDWHLGKKLFKQDRIEEHQSFLNWLFDTAKEHQIDALLVAGDIFDSPNPPNYALKMYYDFLAKISNQNISVYIISGNHDSSGLIDSTNAILREKNIFTTTCLDRDISKHCFKIWNKDKSFYIKLKSLPYFRNYEILDWIKSDHDIVDIDHEMKIKLITSELKNFFQTWPNDYKDDFPSILMAHHLFGNFIEAGSEQALSLSGMDSIPSDLIKNFNYAALGHIHKTQYISKEPPIVYPGSPIAMRFSESNNKSISILSCDEKSINHDFITIPVFVPLVQLKTTLSKLNNEIEQIYQNYKDQKTYLEIVLEIDEPVTGLTEMLREKFSETNIILLSFSPQFKYDMQDSFSSNQVNSYQLHDLFSNFYEMKYGQSNLPKEIILEFNELLEKINNANSQP